MKESSDLTLAADNKVPVSEKKANGKHLNSEAADYYQKVALNMRIIRRKLKLTQQQIADVMEMPRSTYKSLESGKTGIYYFHIAKWSKLTGCDIRLLTRGTKYDLIPDDEDLELFQLFQDLPEDKYKAMLLLLKSL